MRKMGSSKSHNRTRKSKESHMFWIVGTFWCWGGRPFCPRSSQVTKPGLTIITRRWKGSQWSGIIRNHQEKRSSGQLLPPERSWSPSFGTLMEWFWWMWWPEVRQSIRTRISEPSKNWNSVTGECGLTGTHETCWFSTIMPALIQVYEPRRQLPNLVGLCSPIPL